jgi:hypothetical protein
MTGCVGQLIDQATGEMNVECSDDMEMTVPVGALLARSLHNEQKSNPYLSSTSRDNIDMELTENIASVLQYKESGEYMLQASENLGSHAGTSNESKYVFSSNAHESEIEGLGCFMLMYVKLTFFRRAG